jgi:copper resistance protein B
MPLQASLVLFLLAWALFVTARANAQHVHGDPKADAPQHGTKQVNREGWPDPVMDQMPFFYIAAEQLEYRLNDGDDSGRWDVTGWYGGDYNKLWFKTEGEIAAMGPGGGESENQLLYSRLIAPFWDAQIGVRYDEAWGRGADPSRAFAVLGLQGYAPYRFEVG